MKIKMKATVEPAYYEVTPYPIECYWVGVGFIGPKRKLMARRFLRVRTNNGQCKYFYWTQPNKGKEVLAVLSFQKKVQISKERATKHFEK